MKVLLTGAGGLLATELEREFVAAGVELVATTRSELDITDWVAVRGAVRAVGPDYIVNCAAVTDVDWCEQNEEETILVNATAVGYLRDAAEAVGARLITFSTDYVFDGCRSQPYVESDQVGPLSAYGRSKLAAEALLGSASTVIRTSWLCGAGPGIFTTIRRMLDDSVALAFVDDQVGSPTFAADLAAAIVPLLNDPPPGVVHLANTGSVSWFDFARDVAIASGHDPHRVRPIFTQELDPPRAAKRPVYSVLASERVGGLRDYREALAELVASLE